MSALYWTDIAYNSDTGQLVPCTSNSATAVIQFGPIIQPIPEPGRDIRVCYAFGHVYAVVKGQNTGDCYAVRDDGIGQKITPTYGNQCVGIIPTVDGVMVVAVITAYKWIQQHCDPTLGVKGMRVLDIPPVIVGTSQGFLDLSVTGDPVWTDLNRLTTLPNGVQLALWMTRGSYTIGQGFVSPAQVSCWDGAQMHTVWQGDTSFPPRINVTPSGAAMAGIATDAITVVSSPFGPYVVDGPTPIPPEPIPPQPQPAIPVPPEPTPVPPTPEPVMPDTIQFRLDGSTGQWEFGTLVFHPDGAPYKAIQFPDGRYASLTPAGSWQAPAGSAGAWERFIPCGDSILAAPRDGGHGSVVDIAHTQGKSS